MEPPAQSPSMQHDPGKVGQLVDNRPEQVPTHICWRLGLLVSARAGGAQQIAAIGDFQVDTDLWADGDPGASACGRLVIEAGIDALVNSRAAAENAHCDRPVTAAFFR